MCASISKYEKNSNKFMKHEKNEFDFFFPKNQVLIYPIYAKIYKIKILS